MVRRARTGDTVLVKSREMTWTQHCHGGWVGEEVKTAEKNYISPFFDLTAVYFLKMK
jgi:hypothetical protein